VIIFIGNHLASVGLDRFLRVYDTSKTHTGEKDSTSGNNKINCSSKMVCAAYLKNRLNCCLLADIEVKKSKVKATKNRGVVGDDDTLRSNPNFDSDAEDEEDSEDNDDENDDDGDEMNVDEEDDEEDGDGDEDDEDEDNSEEDGSDEDGEGDDDDDADADDQVDSDGVNDSGDDSDVDRKGVGKGQYSSRRERVAAVAKSTNAKTKAKTNPSNSKNGSQSQNKKRRL
jgi:hypothetical protein